jgi:hypothetical protein
MYTLAPAPRKARAAHVRAQDHHLGRRHTGDPAQQNALATAVVAQQSGGDVGRHAPGNLAHGTQHGQRAIIGLNVFVGDGGDIPSQQGVQVVG